MPTTAIGRDRTPDRTPDRTLIVEDDDDASRTTLAAILHRRGLDVRAVPTLEEGLTQLAVWRPRSVVLDLMLPDGLGVELLRVVRANRLPVRVAIVSAAGNALATDAMALAPDLYLRKPVREIDRLLEFLGVGPLHPPPPEAHRPHAAYDGT